MSRPEQVAPADVFYNEEEAKKYTMNTRMIEIQQEITERALEILAIPVGKPRLLLDIGCGSGISGGVLSDHEHMWIGMDISRAMLNVASERELEGDLMHSDMGHGFGFRPGTFDGAVSISALQWLCSAEQRNQNPFKRLNKFFASLYACLIKGARCAFQFYPDSPQQVEMITNAAMKNGFTGGLIIDYPNSQKAKKYYLFLLAGYSEEIMNEARSVIMPKARTGDESDSEEDSDEDNSSVGSDIERVDVKGRKKKNQMIKKTDKFKTANPIKKKDRRWIMGKKERQRKQGKQVKRDSKYSGRKRPSAFN